MFDVSFRDQVSDSILELVASDARVRAGAVVGSLALTSGDRYSDLDYSFAVDDNMDLRAVLDDWTASLSAQYELDVLLDLPSGPTLYRVFLFPGALQVDLSVTPTSSFGRRGETFRLLFGEESVSFAATERPQADMAGYAVHHALHARTSIERARFIQAAYWIGELRTEALAIAVSRDGGEPWQARGAHLLGDDVTEHVERTLPASLDAAELRRALRESIGLLLLVSERSELLTDRVVAQLEALASG